MFLLKKMRLLLWISAIGATCHLDAQSKIQIVNNTGDTIHCIIPLASTSMTKQIEIKELRKGNLLKTPLLPSGKIELKIKWNEPGMHHILAMSERVVKNTDFVIAPDVFYFAKYNVQGSFQLEKTDYVFYEHPGSVSLEEPAQVTFQNQTQLPIYNVWVMYNVDIPSEIRKLGLLKPWEVIEPGKEKILESAFDPDWDPMPLVIRVSLLQKDGTLMHKDYPFKKKVITVK